MRIPPVSLLCGIAVAVASISFLPNDVLRAQPGGAPVPGKKYAVLVGVEDYEHGTLREPPLKYACDDADALAKVLRAGGYEVSLLTDSAGQADANSAPTKANIDARIKETLRQCKATDTVILAFAGHGLQFAGERDAYFCPRDARPFPDETGSLVSISGIYSELEKSFAGVKIILVDACRNDPNPARGRGLDADSAPPPPRGVAALFSCSAGQRAFEHDEFQHGIFFHHILNGLNGAAADADGEVTFDALSSHVRRHVPRDVTRLLANQRQYPNLKADLIGVPPVLVKVEIKIPANPVVQNPGGGVPANPVTPQNVSPLPRPVEHSPPAVVTNDKNSAGPLPSLEALLHLNSNTPPAPPNSGISPPDANASRIASSEKLFEAAQRLEAMKDLSSALLTYNQVLLLNPQHTEAYRQRARIYFDQKEFDKSLADLNALLALQSTDADAYFERGRVWMEKQEYDRAITQFDEALNRATFPSAHFQRGLAYYLKQNYGQAVADYTSYLKLSPDDSAAHYNRGVSWQGLGELEKALDDYNATLKLEPEDTDGLLARGMLLFSKGQYEAVVRDFTSFLKQQPEHFEARLYRGISQEHTRMYPQAIDDVRAAVRLKPDEALAHNALAWLLATVPDARLRNGQQALQHATKACELTEWKEIYYLDTLAAAYAETGNFAKAVEYQSKAIPAVAPEHKADFQKRLDGYKAHRPHRLDLPQAAAPVAPPSIAPPPPIAPPRI